MGCLERAAATTGQASMPFWEIIPTSSNDSEADQGAGAADVDGAILSPVSRWLQINQLVKDQYVELIVLLFYLN